MLQRKTGSRGGGDLFGHSQMIWLLNMVNVEKSRMEDFRKKRMSFKEIFHALIKKNKHKSFGRFMPKTSMT